MGQITFNKSTVFPVKNQRKLFPFGVGTKRAYECASVRKERHSHVFGVGGLLAQKKPRQESRKSKEWWKVYTTHLTGALRQHAPLSLCKGFEGTRFGE